MAFADPNENIEMLSLEPGMKVADIGAGSGFYALAAAKRVGTTGKVYAVDVQRDLLSRLRTEAARLKLQNIEAILTDLDAFGALKLADASIDAVILSNVLFLIENKERMVREVLRVLKPKSKILVIDWKDSRTGVGPHKSQFISPIEAAALFSGNGARIMRDFNAGDHHYGFLAQKI